MTKEYSYKYTHVGTKHFKKIHSTYSIQNNAINNKCFNGDNIISNKKTDEITDELPSFSPVLIRTKPNIFNFNL